MTEVPSTVPEWLDAWLKAAQRERERQTGYLKIISIAVSVLAAITLIVLAVTACSTLGVYVL